MIKMPPIQYSEVQCAGGFDQLTPTLQLKPGVLRDVMNYEVGVTGGYGRIGGYEAFDGQASPSSAEYQIVQVGSFTNTPAVGDTLAGADSGTTSVVAAVGSNYMVVTKSDGSYTAGVHTDGGRNLLSYPEDWTNAYWGGLATRTTNTIEDTSTALQNSVQKTLSGYVLNDAYCVQVEVAKDAIGRATRFSALSLSIPDANATNRQLYLKFDTNTGEYVLHTAQVGITVDGYGVVDAGSVWLVWLAVHKTTDTNGNITAALQPSLGASATWVTSVTATGIITASKIKLEIGTTPTEYVSPTDLGEIVNVGATEIGMVEFSTVELTAKQIAQYYNDAADIYRADIGPIPGSGSTLGGVLFGGVLYGFRANAAGTAVDMYKSSAAGWVQVDFEYEVEFSNANTGVEDGDTLTQGGVTATIRRVVVQTGTLASGTNTGRLIISITAGGNFAAGAATTTGAGALTLSGAQTAITLAAGGKFEFDQHNFFGNQNGLRLYGCDGVNRCFEFDGTYFVPIETGSTPDTPKHLKCFQDHLFVQIASTNLHSGYGDPYNWTTTAGASYKALGDTLTGYAVQPGTGVSGAMAIYGQNSATMLYGTSADDWQYASYIKGVGAKDYSIQVVGSQTLCLDDRGVMNLAASQNYGNFDQSAITSNIQPFINSKRNSASASCISREKSQYRLFFSDGYALYATIVNGKYKGATKILFDHPVTCACDGEISGGGEAAFFGSTDGYMYQLDKGSSFNGSELIGYITFNWNNCGSPRTLKSYKRLSVEMQGDAYVGINIAFSLAYGSSDEIQPGTQDYDANFSGSATWDDASITWDDPNITWDGTSIFPTEIEMGGTGENVQITISSGTDYIYPFTINSYILHYIMRRALR